MANTVLGVFVSGRGSNLQSILHAIESGTLAATVGVVISDNPHAPALAWLKDTRIPVLCIERSSFSSRDQFEAALVTALTRYKVELVVLAGFMRLLSPLFLAQFNGRVMNVHPSLLPAFPGLNAHQQALDYGVRVSGCTIHFVDAGMDSGPVIMQQAVPVLAEDTVESLAQRILEEEHKLYPLAISLYQQGRLKICGRQVRIAPERE